MKGNQKIISILLCVMMLLMAFPLAAFSSIDAAEEIVSEEIAETAEVIEGEVPAEETEEIAEESAGEASEEPAEEAFAEAEEELPTEIEEALAEETVPEESEETEPAEAAEETETTETEDADADETDAEDGDLMLTLQDASGAAKIVHFADGSEEYFATLQLAEQSPTLAAGDTVYLLQDVKENNIQVKAVNHTIDLGGYTVDAASAVDEHRAFVIGSNSEPMAASIVIQNGTITNGSTDGNGGGIYAASSTKGGSLTITDVTISLCSANSTGMGGGGIYVEKVGLTLNGNTIIKNCQSRIYGGGVFAYKSDLSLLGNTEIASCYTNKLDRTKEHSDDAGDELDRKAHGGGVFYWNPSETADDLTSFEMSGNIRIHNNTSRLGGGICIESFGPCNIYSGSIYDNTAYTSGGGLMFNYTYSISNCGEHSLNLYNAVIYENEADTGSGGGMHFCSHSRVNFSGLGIAVFDNIAHISAEDVFCRSTTLKSVLSLDMLGEGLNEWHYGTNASQDGIEGAADGALIPFDRINNYLGVVNAKNDPTPAAKQAALDAATVFIHGNHASTMLSGINAETGKEIVYDSDYNSTAQYLKGRDLAGGGGLYSNNLIKCISDASNSQAAELSKTYTVVKNWIGSDGNYADVPEGFGKVDDKTRGIKVTLLKDGAPYSENAFAILNEKYGWQAVFTNLVFDENSVISVREEPENESDTAAFNNYTSNTPIVIPVGGTTDQFKITLTNTLSHGDLTVSKTVTGDNAEDLNKAFKFTVMLNKDEINGLYGSEGSGMTFINGVATFELKHGESKTAVNLPAGITYTVTEDYTGYKSSAEDGSITGTITANKTAEAAFTNTYVPKDLDNTGSIVLKKDFGGDNQYGDANNVTYTFRVENDLTGEDKYSQDFELKPGDGYQYTVTGLKAGNYTVTEVGGDVLGYTLNKTGNGIKVALTEYISNGRDKVLKAGEAKIQNTYVKNAYTESFDDEDAAVLTVKKVDGADHGILLGGAKFTLSLDGTEWSKTFTTGSSGADLGIFKITNADLADIKETLTEGKDYSFTLCETDPPEGYKDPDSTETWEVKVKFNGSEAVVDDVSSAHYGLWQRLRSWIIGASGEDYDAATKTLTVENEYDPKKIADSGSLVLKKTIGENNCYAAAETKTYQFVVTKDGEAISGSPFDVPANASLTINDLAEGTYVVSETASNFEGAYYLVSSGSVTVELKDYELDAEKGRDLYLVPGEAEIVNTYYFYDPGPGGTTVVKPTPTPSATPDPTPSVSPDPSESPVPTDTPAPGESPAPSESPAQIVDIGDGGTPRGGADGEESLEEIDAGSMDIPFGAMEDMEVGDPGIPLGGLVQTGDSSPIAALCVCAVLAIGGLIGLVATRKKEDK